MYHLPHFADKIWYRSRFLLCVAPDSSSWTLRVQNNSKNLPKEVASLMICRRKFSLGEYISLVKLTQVAILH